MKRILDPIVSDPGDEQPGSHIIQMIEQIEEQQKQIQAIAEALLQLTKEVRDNVNIIANNTSLITKITEVLNNQSIH